MPLLERFAPVRTAGIWLHAAASLVLGGGSAVFFILASEHGSSSLFILYLLSGAALLLPLALVMYRWYALLNAAYTWERDGLRLRWGLRAEDIPLDAIEWVRHANESGFEIERPRFTWPGAYLGNVSMSELGEIEFMASDRESMLLVATQARIFVISPEMPGDFLRTYHQILEMGSLTPLPASTTEPAAYVRSLWKDRLARTLFLAGLGMGLVVLIFISLMIPAHALVPLGYDIQGRPAEALPAQTMILLPVLNGLIFAGDTMAALFLFRKPHNRLFAYALQAASLLTSVLFFVAALLFFLSAA